MKRIVIQIVMRVGAVLLAIALQSSAFGQQPPQEAPVPPIADSEISELAERYFDATDRRDAKTLDELLADECLIFYPRSVVATKASLLDDLRKPDKAADQGPKTHKISDVQTRRVGGTAILTAQVAIKRGDAQEISNRRTLVWAWKEGRWRLLHDQWSMIGDAQEAEFWSAYFKGNNPNFNRKPNALLAKTIEGLRPGKALDAGMGQGRNAIHLAKHGWSVTGFDRAEGALAMSRKLAKEQGVKITPILQADDEFYWGWEQWDLIALLYFDPVRDHVAHIRESLKVGGLVVVEGFIVPPETPSDGVEYHAGELRKMFENGFKILRYEETEGLADYGRKTTKLVRLVASKTPMRVPSPSQASPPDATSSDDGNVNARRSIRGR